MRSPAIAILTLVLALSGCSSSPSTQEDTGLQNEPLVKNIAVLYSEDIPNFPTSVTDYRLDVEKEYDYIRVFSESKWLVPIVEFDPKSDGGASMSCQPYFWILRWRSNNPGVTILASAGLTDFGKYNRVYKPVEGGAGYMEGYSCVVPAFKFGKALNGNKSNLVDVNFEYQIWEYRPKI